LTGPILPQLAASSLQIASGLSLSLFLRPRIPERFESGENSYETAVCYSVFPAKIRNAKDIPFPHNKSFSYRQKSALEPWAIIKAWSGKSRANEEFLLPSE
jgi:hypothetical protein